MIIINQEEERYYVITESCKVFYYTDGHFAVTDNIRLAYGFTKLTEAIKALDYCTNLAGPSKIIKARLILEEINGVDNITIKDHIRKEALAKLTPVEQEVLGLIPEKG